MGFHILFSCNYYFNKNNFKINIMFRQKHFKTSTENFKFLNRLRSRFKIMEN